MNRVQQKLLSRNFKYFILAKVSMKLYIYLMNVCKSVCEILHKNRIILEDLQGFKIIIKEKAKNPYNAT